MSHSPFRQNFPSLSSNIKLSKVKFGEKGKEAKMKKQYEDRPKILYLLIMAAAYLLSVTTLLNEPSPLAAAFIGGLSGFDCFAAFLGAGIGFVTSGDLTVAIPSLIASASVCLLRFFFCKGKSLAADVAISVVSGAAILLTGAITVDKPSRLLTILFLALAGGISCFALARFRHRSDNMTEIAAMKPPSLLPYGIALVFLISSLSSFSYNIFNFGGIVSVLAVLIGVYRYRFLGAGILGIICAIGMALSFNLPSAAGIALSAGALAAAIALPKGRLVETVACLFTTIIALVLFGMDRESLAFAASLSVASVIFMVLPVKQLLGMTGRGSRQNGYTSSNPANIFAERLRLVGNTMGELKYAVEKTAEALEDSHDHDITNVYNSACDTVCRDCRFNMKCWGDEYNDSVRTMNGLLRNLRSGVPVTAEHFTGAISERCQRKSRLANAINKKYEDFTSAGQMQRRVKEMRGILTKQLENTEKLFCSISDEFDGSVKYNTEASRKAESLLERCGLAAPKAGVKIIDGKMTLEAYGNGDLTCSAEELGDLLAETLDREFDLPSIIKFGDKIRVSAFERAEYGVKSAVCQLSRKKDGVNGDYVTDCVDGKGFYYGILSDGMGSGTRARIDSAFACGLLTKFLESGIDTESAIEMLNTSLMVKSSDESFATLDVCKVDLYTGRTTIYKAGGADSFVRSGKSITKIHGDSLPIGVAESTAVSSHSFIVGEDDVIIMTSDGADLSEKWLEQALNKESAYNLEELVKTVATAARFSSEKDNRDDISVVAMQIKK